MAKTERSKKIWHLPKRGSVHQTIAMIHIISDKNIDGARWNSQKQEVIGTEMGKAGLTKNGRSLTQQSVRTLLANMPQYLGFISKSRIGNSSTLDISKVGNKLIKIHPKEKVFYFSNEGRAHDNTIETYIKNNVYITHSEVFKDQLLKLFITNPNLKKDCEDILLFPFRFTIKLLLELDYLDKEELAYIVFHSKNNDSIKTIKERIISFREQKIERRIAEIREYSKTEEGKLTLIKAPTSGYYMELCASSDLCEKSTVKIKGYKNLPTIKIKDRQKVIDSLREFENVEPFDFGDDIELWSVYFGDPDIKFPPFNMEFIHKEEYEILVTISNNGLVYKSFSLGKETKSKKIPVFAGANYEVSVIDLLTGKELDKFNKSFEYLETQYEIVVDKHYSRTNVDPSLGINEMFSRSSGFDESYESKLKVLGKYLGKNYLLPNYRGGRLEQMFSEEIEKLEAKHIIDSYQWYGRIGEYGLALPALGGKEGFPDIVFEIEDYIFVLELTTIRSDSLQWSAEGASVPEHIEKIKIKYPEKKVIGIFSAPKISPRVQVQLGLHLKHNNTKIMFIDVFTLSKIFVDSSSKEDLVTRLLNQ